MSPLTRSAPDMLYLLSPILHEGMRWNKFTFFYFTYFYRGADKSLARTGGKQATATEDFDFHISYLQS